MPGAALDDEGLVAAVRAGDRAAFGTLVERHQDRLYNALWRLGGCPEEARDAVQEAFVQAFLKLSAFRGDSKFATWLYRIGVNQALTAKRRRRPATSLEVRRDEQGWEPVDHGPDPSDQATAEENMTAVHQALEELDDSHRQVLVLREMEGQSYEAIAEILAIPIGTVRSRIFRARLQLRDKLRGLSE
jgi:RNA polymerase sigma-70 factor (ECF subfamily)